MEVLTVRRGNAPRPSPVSGIDSDTARIRIEYQHREREIQPDFYSWAKPANLLMHQQTVRSCLRLLQQAGMFPLTGRRVADIGSGGGTWLLEFMQWGASPADVAGLDLTPARIECTRACLPQADLRVGNAAALPWPDESFDLVSQFTLFMNTFDRGLAARMANEMLRVLKPGGAILWFDARVGNPRNRQIRAIRVGEIRSLFPGCTVDLRPALLAPPLSRLLAGWAWPLAEALQALPLLCTHYAGLIRKPAGRDFRRK